MIPTLTDFLETQYLQEDYPTLRAQCSDFSARQPFLGVRILDATPLFFNTTAKYLPLLAGGAHLTLSCVEGVPYDPKFVEWISDIGMPIIKNLEAERSVARYDLISDCIGLHADLNPKIGFCELTRSGLERFKYSSKPCFDSDSSRIKRIEAALGTGDGFARGLQASGHEISPDQRWLLFGFGKIGQGVAFRLRAAGAFVTVVESKSCQNRLKGTPVGDFPWIDMNDSEAVTNAVCQSTHIVTATSSEGVIGRNYPIKPFLEGQLLINMGAEDEYGPGFRDDQVLNRKRALNFSLPEPTRLRYIETTFALQNAGLEWLLYHPHSSGIIPAPESLQEDLLSHVRSHGAIRHELALIGL